MTPIPQDLIIRALALTGKTMEDMNVPKYIGIADTDVGKFDLFEPEFSYPKFYAYLLSEPFLGKYSDAKARFIEATTGLKMKRQLDFRAGEVGEAIYEYQSGNSAPIVELLTKI